MAIILVCGCTCWWLQQQPVWWKCWWISWDDQSAIIQIKMTVDKLSSARLQVRAFCSSVPLLIPAKLPIDLWWPIMTHTLYWILSFQPYFICRVGSRGLIPGAPLPSPSLNLGDVLRNAISGPTITLTISWWSESEALWDIDSPHPETASIIG